MSHVLVHGYANENQQTLFDTAVNGISELRKKVSRNLEETNWEDWESDNK